MVQKQCKIEGKDGTGLLTFWTASSSRSEVAVACQGSGTAVNLVTTEQIIRAELIRYAAYSA
jgi:hypothetical protein